MQFEEFSNIFDAASRVAALRSSRGHDVERYSDDMLSRFQSHFQEAAPASVVYVEPSHDAQRIGISEDTALEVVSDLQSQGVLLAAARLVCPNNRESVDRVVVETADPEDLAVATESPCPHCGAYHDAVEWQDIEVFYLPNIHHSQVDILAEIAVRDDHETSAVRGTGYALSRTWRFLLSFFSVTGSSRRREDSPIGAATRVLQANKQTARPETAALSLGAFALYSLVSVVVLLALIWGCAELLPFRVACVSVAALVVASCVIYSYAAKMLLFRTFVPRAIASVGMSLAVGAFGGAQITGQLQLDKSGHMHGDVGLQEPGVALLVFSFGVFLVMAVALIAWSVVDGRQQTSG